ncbi:M3 family metallopeptidase [Leifsonia sp. YAF41]|uniref:M3 family metallopeptidase n=1 Tax=Leifsonia sp. YAF41 TaxID=3233086 RepID=UPI003F9DFF34
MADFVNPLLVQSTLPFQLPPFAEISDEHYAPALEAGMREQLAEIATLLADPAPASFLNTLIPLERSGRTLLRALVAFGTKTSNDSNPAIQAIDETFAPLLAAHRDAITLNPELYARIAAVHEKRDELGLDAESRRLVERYHIEFTLAGAGLSDDDKAALRDYNQRLSSLTTQFEKNLLADTNDLAVWVEEVSELDGLTAGEVSAAAAAAQERGLTSGYLLTLVLPTSQPALAALTNRAVRERVLTASRERGIRGGPHDNHELVLEITRLRAERARLLGFATHAASVTADETAKTPEAVAAMLERLAPAARRNARAEQATLQAHVDDAGESFELRAWDWAFYAEKVRLANFDIDTAAMREYFELERVLRDGVFYAATLLYGITFVERPDLVGWHAEARVFEVSNDDGTPLGLYIADLYTRDSKRGGAWMSSLVSQSHLLQTPAIVTNSMNVPKPGAGEPTLLSFDEVNTLFHEFGHALHGLFAQVTYPKFAGTNVHRDFVEFPSQVNEMWMLWPEVLANYATHYQTGEPLPRQIIDSLDASTTFNEGFATSEYLAAALLDQAWHRIDADAEVSDVAAFEASALAEVGLDNPVVPTRYSSTYFAHTFAGGYDAGYYSYIWSEVLDADAVAWFTENGGLTRANGDRFRHRLLGVGGSRDPLQAYRDFAGRDADIQPLLDRRGLN